MSFDITPTAAQHDLARRTHEFAEKCVRPVALDYDQRQEFPWPVLEEAAERGFYSPLFYRDLIGDPTGLSLPMFMEELFWGCAGIGLAVVMPALALSAIGQAASPEQMLRWAPECFGSPGDLKLAALAISEPEGGSDVRNLRTRAHRDGSEKDADWIIDGHKMWIGNGGIADVHVVNAVVDEELGHKGQALFIVPGGTTGLELVRKLDKLGCRASHTAELKFNGVRVPAENLLGGQEKLEHKLAKAREAIEGGKHSGSATMGRVCSSAPKVADRPRMPVFSASRALASLCSSFSWPPSRLSPGTRTPLNLSSAVCDARQPSFSNLRTISRPGVPPGTTNSAWPR